MRKWLLMFFLTCVCIQLQAQVNYVRNPPLEDYVKCPNNTDEINLATNWFSIDSFYYWPADSGYSISNLTGRICTPEYCNVCTRYPWLSGLPYGPDFYQYPRTGNGLAEVQMFFDGNFVPPLNYYRDYLQGRLYKPLTAGKSYCVTFYVNLAEQSGYAIDHIGAYLDDGKIDTTGTCSLPQTQYTPQVVTTSIVYDTANWIKVEGSFTANGSERFITIGNFADKAHTNYVQLSPFNSNYTWYLVDDVSVIQSDTKADAGIDRHITRGDSTFIGRTPEVGLDCKWYRNGQFIDSGAGIWVKPSTTTSYVVEQTLCGLVTRDTMQVQVWAVGVPGVNGGAQRYELYPNPSNGSIELHQWVADERPVRVVMRSAIGDVVYKGSLQFKSNKAPLQLQGIAAGVYLVSLENGDGEQVLKLVMQ